MGDDECGTVLWESLPQCRFVNHKSHMTWPELERLRVTAWATARHIVQLERTLRFGRIYHLHVQGGSVRRGVSQRHRRLLRVVDGVELLWISLSSGLPKPYRSEIVFDKSSVRFSAWHWNSDLRFLVTFLSLSDEILGWYLNYATTGSFRILSDLQFDAGAALVTDSVGGNRQEVTLACFACCEETLKEAYEITFLSVYLCIKLKTKLRGLSPRANCTDRGTADRHRS
jgi:hypothetical protein